MRWLCLCLPWFALASTSPLEHPVLLIPGVGGSVLQVGMGNYPEQIAWVGGFELTLEQGSYMPRLGETCTESFNWLSLDYKLCYELTGGDANFRNNLLGYYNASTGTIDRAFGDQDTPVVPLLSDLCGLSQRSDVAPSQLCGISYLMSALGKGLSKIAAEVLFYGLNGRLGSPIDYFGPMVAQISRDYGFVPGKTLFGFPYDWRLSNIQNADLLAGRVDELCSRTGKKINLVAHSMGNLLTMAFFAQYPQLAERCVQSWSAIGAPFQGAGGLIYQAVVEGYNFGDVLVCNCTSRPFSVQAPSVFEMLPAINYPSSANVRPYLSYQTLQEPVAINSTLALEGFLSQAYEGYPFCNEGEERIFNLNAESFASGVRFQQEIVPKIANMTLPEVYVIYGTQLATVNAVNYTHPVESPQELIKFCGATNCGSDLCEWPSCVAPDNPSLSNCTKETLYVDGDGTVPAISAQNPPFNVSKDNFYAAIGVEHMALVQSTNVIRQVFSGWLNYKRQNPPRGDNPSETTPSAGELLHGNSDEGSYKSVSGYRP